LVWCVFSYDISFILKCQIKLLGKTDLKGGHEIFMFIKKRHGLRKVEKHCPIQWVLGVLSLGVKHSIAGA
jgi:hypothetical protein